MSQITSLGSGGSGSGAIKFLTVAGPIQVGPDGAGEVFLLGAGGVSVTNTAANTITITGSGIIGWNDITTATVAMAVNQGYVMDRATLVTATLPAVAPFGSIISIAGKGVGGWSIAQNAGQTIHFGVMDTTTGVLGSLASMSQYDCVELLCITANTDFVVRTVVGNLAVT